MKRWWIGFAAMALFATPVQANEQSFGNWVKELKQEAQQQGISASILDQAFADMTPNKRVIELDRKQPESTMTFAQYLKRVVNDRRAQQGRKLFNKHQALLQEISAKYGVQPRFIVALWGIETNYGGNTGGFNMVRSLATLAYDGRRSAFFRKELLNALKIVNDGHVKLQDFKGSWAGAMGQTQFMPSSFLSYAVDYDGDGRKDIWGTLPDVFASIANYLKNTGWNNDETWGREVSLAAGFQTDMADLKVKKSLQEWNQLGVARLGGGALPDRAGVEGSVVFPGKVGERSYLVYRNFDRILKWNRSKYFATAVGTLSDRIAGRS